LEISGHNGQTKLGNRLSDQWKYKIRRASTITRLQPAHPCSINIAVLDLQAKSKKTTFTCARVRVKKNIRHVFNRSIQKASISGYFSRKREAECSGNPSRVVALQFLPLREQE